MRSTDGASKLCFLFIEFLSLRFVLLPATETTLLYFYNRNVSVLLYRILYLKLSPFHRSRSLFLVSIVTLSKTCHLKFSINLDSTGRQFNEPPCNWSKAGHVIWLTACDRSSFLSTVGTYILLLPPCSLCSISVGLVLLVHKLDVLVYPGLRSVF